LFRSLTRLREIALYRDPMLCSAERAARQLLARSSAPGRMSLPVRYAAEVVRLIQREHERSRKLRAKATIASPANAPYP
jgi:hypothetical protein